jgi:hypothetical protein
MANENDAAQQYLGDLRVGMRPSYAMPTSICDANFDFATVSTAETDDPLPGLEFS